MVDAAYWLDTAHRKVGKLPRRRPQSLRADEAAKQLWLKNQSEAGRQKLEVRRLVQDTYYQ